MSESKRQFETERTRRFRAGDLSARDESTIANVETHGCEVVQIDKNSAGPGWSFTVGIYDTCGKPEIITVGLRPKTAHFLLNEAAHRLRAGVDLATGRHREMVGEVECEFRPVDPRWVLHLMGWAIWYYGGDGFPVLQAVYPDRENRFPEEPGFDKTFEQPLLQSGVPETRAERDFWASADPDSSLFNWNFPDPPHTMVFLSKLVQTGAEPVIDHLKSSFSELLAETETATSSAPQARIICPIIRDWVYGDRMSGDAVLRSRLCRGPSCGAVFYVCSHCDRGQRYCGESCRAGARLIQRRAANQRYQRSGPGKDAHRLRQRAYRQRSCRPRVTDQASRPITMPAVVAPPSPSRCAICHAQSRWVDPFGVLWLRRGGRFRPNRPAAVQKKAFPDDR